MNNDHYQPVAEDELHALMNRAKEALAQLCHPQSEARRPIFIEFSGSPKAGKSSIIGIVAHFLKRAGFRVGTPPEGASVPTPRDLKDDLLAFNAWSACYAIREILERSHDSDPDDVIVLDRGRFDAVCWMEFLRSKEHRLSDEGFNAMREFLDLDIWKCRVNATFLFVADRATSLQREADSKLTLEPGRAMNEEFLTALTDCYRNNAKNVASDRELVYLVDTSIPSIGTPNFQRIAYNVATEILNVIDAATKPELLVGMPFTNDGFVEDGPVVSNYLRGIEDSPEFRVRDEAEKASNVQQIVPYGLLRKEDGSYLALRRKVSGERPSLAGRVAILVGGHAEKKDWNEKGSRGVFEACLRRELDEELIGLELRNFKLLGVINDTRNECGTKHLAVVFEVLVGGTAAVRRQTHDKEFGRERVEWLSGDVIAKRVAELDPWSQLVAEWKFGAKLNHDEAGLFTHG